MRKLLLTLPIFTCVLLGCKTTDGYKQAADNEVYQIIDEKGADVPGLVSDLTLEREPYDPLADLPLTKEAPEFLGESMFIAEEARIISLEEALRLAFSNNRNYQSQREIVYLAALDLTLDRDDFAPTFRAGASADYARSTRDIQKSNTLNLIAEQSPQLAAALGELTGQPADLVNRYATLVDQFNTVTRLDQPRSEIMNERSVDGRTNVGFSVLLAGGAQLAVDLTSDFLRFLTGSSRVDTASALTATLTRPLLRGGGSDVVQERLTQSERNVLYALRDFTRFRKEFAVQIASEYYRVLQRRDIVSNNYRGYLSLRKAAEREKALEEEGWVTKADLARREEAFLSSQDRWIQSIRSYLEALDSFKITLALDADAKIVLDPAELEALKTEGIEPTSIDQEEAVRVALVTRLDLYNTRDEVEDNERRIKVAANALKADIDFVAQASVDSMDGDRFQELDFQRARWNAGLDLDLPIERTAERNAYRRSLIQGERARRALELSEDNIKIDVRSAWRNLEQARRTYDIQRVNVGINEERVELEDLKNEIGRATALDAIDAENALNAARNALTAAVVSHRVAKLEFWRDMGILYIQPNGKWEEPDDDIAD